MKSIQSVSFYNQTIQVLQHNEKPYVGMKSIVENIGLDWASQFRRISNNQVLSSSIVMMTMVAEDGKNRKILCLPLGYLNGWLFGIDVNRVRPEIKDTLIKYQKECFDVLYQHFMPQVCVSDNGHLINSITKNLNYGRWLVIIDHNGIRTINAEGKNLIDIEGIDLLSRDAQTIINNMSEFRQRLGFCHGVKNIKQLELELEEVK